MREQAKQQQKWWQQIKKHPVAIVLIALLAVVIVLVILIILGYIFNWDWTGLNATDFTSTPQKFTRTIIYQPEKTLWDWLQLLIIPAVLAVAGYVINLTISTGEQAATEQRAKSEQEAADKRAITEREIAKDNQCAATLHEYIDQISELLLKVDLTYINPERPTSKIVRLRTLIVLPQLDIHRKRLVVQFLFESNLIKIGNFSPKSPYISHIDLSGADLIKAYLSSLDLTKANLGSTNLIGANLYWP